jgi:translation initiation factor IF-1
MKLLASDGLNGIFRELESAVDDCESALITMAIIAAVVILFAALGVGGLIGLLLGAFKSADKTSVERATVANIREDEAFRIWRDSTDRYSVNAKLAGIYGTTVRLLQEDGVILELPVAKLSQADVAYLATKQVIPKPMD